jgi:hypothetical protein
MISPAEAGSPENSEDNSEQSARGDGFGVSYKKAAQPRHVAPGSATGLPAMFPLSPIRPTRQSQPRPRQLAIVICGGCSGNGPFVE